MQKIFKHGQWVADAWLLLRPDEAGSLPAFADEADVIVPWRYWREVSAGRPDRSGRMAVWLEPDDEPADLYPFVQNMALIAVDFPSFTDGRGYSIARLLRERYSYKQELRALGDVGPDQLLPLWLVGFDSFEIKQQQSIEPDSLALEAFPDHYQANYREALPLFRRSITSA